MKKSTKEDIIKKCISVHGVKYDYSKVEYKSVREKICIICPEHGEFWQTPMAHIWGKSGCPECGKNKKHQKLLSTTEEFVQKAKQIHGDKYDYSKVKYINSSEKICIVCEKHGDFWQLPSIHLRGIGCPECGKIKKAKSKTLTTDEFIQKAKQIHGDKYDYSKVEYENMKSTVCIVCKKHGEFLQVAHTHLTGHGCPKCSTSSLENNIIKILNENNIRYKHQYKFDWLVDKKHLIVDFYLPDYNIVIECQGLQHFKPSNFGSKKGEKNKMFEYVVKHDKLKYKKCKEHGIDILYFSNLNIQYPYKVYEDEYEIINEILKHKRNDF